ncbi:hypothetical protein ACOSP7_000927 [Xanthoceras sorbifolium]
MGLTLSSTSQHIFNILALIPLSLSSLLFLIFFLSHFSLLFCISCFDSDFLVTKAVQSSLIFFNKTLFSNTSSIHSLSLSYFNINLLSYPSHQSLFISPFFNISLY